MTGAPGTEAGPGRRRRGIRTGASGRRGLAGRPGQARFGEPPFQGLTARPEAHVLGAPANFLGSGGRSCEAKAKAWAGGLAGARTRRDVLAEAQRGPGCDEGDRERLTRAPHGGNTRGSVRAAPGQRRCRTRGARLLRRLPPSPPQQPCPVSPDVAPQSNCHGRLCWKSQPLTDRPHSARSGQSRGSRTHTPSRPAPAARAGLTRSSGKA